MSGSMMCCFKLDMQQGRREITITKQKTLLPDLHTTDNSQYISKFFKQQPQKVIEKVYTFLIKKKRYSTHGRMISRIQFPY